MTTTQQQGLPHLELSEDSQRVLVEVDLDRIHGFFTCGVCKGFFRDPHTISECVHTFCKSCVVRKLQESNMCPTCQCKTTMNSVRPDHTIQSLFIKIFPEVEKQDEERERKWYEDNNIPMPEKQTLMPASTSGKTSKPKPEKRQRSDQSGPSTNANGSSKDASKPAPRLRLEVRSESGDQDISDSYLEAASTTKVEKMRNYIARRLDIAPDRVVLMCDGQVLPLEHSMEFVQRTKWPDPTTNMVWRYKILSG
jgi:polycomb group RING finger protein 3